jgi:hypothetical protein
VHVKQNDPLVEARNIVRGCARRWIVEDVARAMHRETYLGLIYGFLACYYSSYPRTPPEGAGPGKAH